MYSDLYESYRSIYNLDEAKVDDTLTRPIDRSDARTARAGGDEPQRMLKHFMGRGVKKKRGMKEEYFNLFIDYLLDEGYADSWEDAEIIVSNMSQNWLSNILEGKETDKEKNVAQLSSDLASLRQKQKELTSRVISNPSDTKAQNALKQIVQQIKNSSGARSQLASIQGVSSATMSAPKSKPSSEADKLSPEEKAAFRSTSMRSSNITPEKKAELRASIAAGAEKARKARYGSTPQTPASGEKAAPSGETRAQRRAGAASDELVGGMDPTYYNRATGQRERIKAAGPTDVNYGGRGRKRVTGTYQQGATGSGERGATPAGSTVDPTRRRLRGTGRSTIQ